MGTVSFFRFLHTFSFFTKKKTCAKRKKMEKEKGGGRRKNARLFDSKYIGNNIININKKILTSYQKGKIKVKI
ncbi:MAG TPA: hypothetical protein C5S37_14215 [Methanophagales archaeon]|nr:hypothetical protein [Methanophagales archaeon]